MGGPGICGGAYCHRGGGEFVGQVGGKTMPTLNGIQIGQDAIALAHNDMLNLAGDEMEFLLKER